MAVKKKYKKLTNKEKQFRKQLKDELRADGIIPAIKPRLNRKKFLQETKKEYEDNINVFDDIYYLVEAIAYMTPSEAFKIDSEAVGIIKLMKMTVEIKKFRQKKLENGEKTYKITELYDNVIRPIKEM